MTKAGTAENRSKVLLAPHFRTVDEILSRDDLDRLMGFADVLWARDEPLPDEARMQYAGETWAYIGARPQVDAAFLERAGKLRVVVEVAGRFPATIDYRRCFAKGIRVLSCAPAFRAQVAEMTLAMMLAGGRGLVTEHERFRRAQEVWQRDRPDSDFSLYGQDVGLLGAGSIAQRLLQLLAPFDCRIRAYDPWLPASQLRQMGCEPVGLDELLTKSRVLVVLAVPTTENKNLLDAAKLHMMRPQSLLVLVSRSHLVDFEALTAFLHEGRLQAAIDVFPEEPLPVDHAIRQAPNVILSPHRAASIARERQAIGRMIVDDLELMARGLPPVCLQVAQPELIPLYMVAGLPTYVPRDEKQ